MPAVDKCINHIDHIRDFFRSLRMNRRRTNIHAFHVLLALCDIALGNDGRINAFFICGFDDLVIDIREVGDIIDFISLMLKVSADCVKDDHRPCVADMNQVVNCRSAYIHADLSGYKRNEFLFMHCECIENSHSLSFLFLTVRDLLYSGNAACLLCLCFTKHRMSALLILQKTSLVCFAYASLSIACLLCIFFVIAVYQSFAYDRKPVAENAL